MNPNTNYRIQIDEYIDSLEITLCNKYQYIDKPRVNASSEITSLIEDIKLAVAASSEDVFQQDSYSPIDEQSVDQYYMY